ncbi:hypothetical protein ACFS07_23825 [Undibacterium arcticum]
MKNAMKTLTPTRQPDCPNAALVSSVRAAHSGSRLLLTSDDGMGQGMDNNYQEMFDALDVCYDKALVMPCLVLIYTIIDSISWLAYGACEQSSKKRFILWVEKVLPWSS